MPNLTQEQIISKWKSEKIVVSICMLAFNHEDYIAEALEGVLAQDVDFGYEIIIHDDASTDETAKFIRGYVSRYPKLIKPIYQSKNQWSRGINPSVFFNYPRVTGDYVAWCEGDDVWTSPSKLKIQIDIMEQRRNIGLCFHLAEIKNCVDSSKGGHSFGAYADASGLIDFDDVFLRRFGMIPTASCVVRRAVMERLAEFMAPRPYLTSGDVHMQTLGALEGGAYFVNEVMLLYKFGSPSSLTKGILSDAEKNVNHHVSCIRGAISMWMNYFPHQSENTLKKVIYKRLIWLFLSDGRGGGLVEKLNISDLYAMYLRVERYFEGLRSRLAGQRVVLYGCGHEAVKIVNSMGAENIEMIIDRDELRVDGGFFGVPFGDFDKLRSFDGALLLVTTMFYDEQALLKRVSDCGSAIKNVVRIEDEILNEIDVSAIWHGDVLIDRETVLASTARVPGWWVPQNGKTALGESSREQV